MSGVLGPESGCSQEWPLHRVPPSQVWTGTGFLGCSQRANPVLCPEAAKNAPRWWPQLRICGFEFSFTLHVCGCASARLEASGQLLKVGLLLHQVCPRNGTQVVGLGGKRLSRLSRLAGPDFRFFMSIFGLCPLVKTPEAVTPSSPSQWLMRPQSLSVPLNPLFPLAPASRRERESVTSYSSASHPQWYRPSLPRGCSTPLWELMPICVNDSGPPFSLSHGNTSPGQRSCPSPRVSQELAFPSGLGLRVTVRVTVSSVSRHKSTCGLGSPPTQIHVRICPVVFLPQVAHSCQSRMEPRTQPQLTSPCQPLPNPWLASAPALLSGVSRTSRQAFSCLCHSLEKREIIKHELQGWRCSSVGGVLA